MFQIQHNIIIIQHHTMEYILREQDEEQKKELYEAFSNERFATVYSHDNESVLSNGHFKGIHSYDNDVDDDDVDDVDDADDIGGKRARSRAPPYLNEQRGDVSTSADYRDEDAVKACASDETLQFQTNSCTNCIIETFHINPKELVVKILAFSIPGRSKILEPCCEQVPLPDSPGFICVGRVMTQTPKFCDIQLNDRVLCLVPIESDARYETYANIPFHAAIKIPKNVDAMTQVSLIQTYLPALQILQSLPYKVKNKKVILNGGVGPVMRSLVHLCILHGAKKIYVPCVKKNREIVRSMGAKTAGAKHNDWGPSYIGEIDLVIDAIGENSFVTSRAVLNGKGHLCVIGNTHSALNGDGLFNTLTKMILDYRISNSSKTSVYTVNASLEKDRESFIQDFEYLSQLLDDGRIEPMFTRVSLDEYRESEDTKVTSINAPVICDPWTEYKWG